MRVRLTALSIALFLSYATNAQQQYFADNTPGISERLEAWQDLKFGLLMHWGTYSQWGIVESWSICPEDLSWATGGRKPGVADDYFTYVKQYEALKKTFNPVKFDPAKWASAAKQAGMKYMVFTTKHHDGFCMFDTKQTDYKVTDAETPFSTNPNSNISKAVFDAFRKNNFWIGAYFSKPDWHSDYYWWKKFPPADRNPSYSISKYPEQWKKFVNYTQAQINELVTDYGKLDILWLDGGWVSKKTEEEVNKNLLEVYENSRWARIPQSQDIDMDKIVTDARKKQPGLIVVDRAVPGPHQNYLTPEQHIPETGLPYPWETCMTMATSWSYVPGDTYKPADELIEKLVDIVSKGGNFLLNIGPSPLGEFDSIAYSRLQEIGAWMNINGEAIYGSRRYQSFEEGDGIRFTQSKDGKNIYVFLFNEPGETINISKVSFDKKMKAVMPGSKAVLKVQPVGEGIMIKIPKNAGKSLKHVWVIKLVKA